MLRAVVAICFAALIAVLSGERILATRGDDGRSRLEGQASVQDGDSLRMNGERLRLVQIDACELGQPATRGGRRFDCGAWARDALQEIVGSRRLRCEAEGRDQYRRVLAECFTADGASVNLAAVRSGAVFVYDRRRAPRRFLEAEDEARDRGAGVWGFVVDRPFDYRRRQG